MTAAPQGLRVVASTSDALACSLVEFASRGEWKVELLTHSEAAQDTTIEVGSDGVHVLPDTALWLRPYFEPPPDDPDERFLLEERLAVLWAAACLTKRPVLSRPSRRGPWGRVTPSARVTEHRAGYRCVRPEVFCTDAARREWPGTWAAERRDGRVGPWPTAGGGPFRARPIAQGEAYEGVTVVGTRAWRRSDEPLAHLELEAQSVSLVKALELDFAVVWWAIAPAEDAASLVRVAPAPTLAEVGHHWPEAAQALLSMCS